MKDRLTMFLPMIVAIGGGLIMVTAGINDNPNLTFFTALRYMNWWGWIGFVIMWGSLVWQFIKIK